MSINSPWRDGKLGVPVLRWCAVVLFTFWVGLVSASTTPPGFLINQFSDAQLKATGSFRWWGLKVYDAALWMPSKGDVDAVFDTPFALKLSYARSLSGQMIADSSADEMERLDQGSASQRKNWLKRMSVLFPSVKEGDSITGVYQPKRGVWFYFNQDLLGAIEDDAFGQAFFAIWLHERTRAPELRVNLLHQKP